MFQFLNPKRKALLIFALLIVIPFFTRSAIAQSETINWMRDVVESRVLSKNLRSSTQGEQSLESADLQNILLPKIVGGTKADPNDNPFQVALLSSSVANNLNAQFCGGTLIRQNFVVTAAHCSDFIRDVNEVQVLTGTRRLDGTGQRHKVARIAIHWNWNKNTFNNDVAVWELTTNTTGIPLATLATSDGPVGNNLLATGWGAVTVEDKITPIDLQRVQIPLVSRSNCNDSNSYNGEITANMLCAGLDAGGRDSCQGDSGGPLTRGTDNTVLTGITSWGYGCARKNLFGVYTRVSSPWIREFINSAMFFVRRGTATAGGINEISLAPLGTNRVVAAMRDGSNHLRLISWDVAGNGSITRRGTATAGSISQVTVVPVGSNRVVTAMRDRGNNLRLISWDVDANGNITRRGTATAGGISEISLAPLGTNRVVAAMRDGSNHLRLISWDVAGNGSITRRGTATAGSISQVTVVPVGSNRVVTAMRDRGNNLRLISWDVTPNGDITRRATATTGPTSRIALTALGSSRVVTAMRDRSNNLRLISWDVTSTGDIARRGTATAGKFTEVAISSLSSNRVVTAMRDRSNDLRLITWDVTGNGTISRRGTAIAGPISKVASADLGNNRVIASMRDGSNDLRLITWDVTFP